MTMLRDAARAFMPYPDAPVRHAERGPLAGLTFAVKDLFDVAGYPDQRRPAVRARDVGHQDDDRADRAAPARRRRALRRQDDHRRACVLDERPERALRLARQRRRARSHQRRLVVGVGVGGLEPASATSRSAATPAARCARRPTTARSSACGRRTAASASKACSTSRRASTPAAGSRATCRPSRASPTCCSAPTRRRCRERVRLLAPTDLWALLSPEVIEAQRGPRARVEAVLGRAAPVDVVLDDFEAMYWSFRYLQGREAWRTDGALIDRFTPPLGPGVKDRFAWAREVTDAQVATATAFRERFRAHLAELLGNDGVLADADDARHRAARERRRSRARGLPQPGDAAALHRRPRRLPAAVAAARRRLGAPLGISLLGPAGSDRSLVRLAERIVGAPADAPTSQRPLPASAGACAALPTRIPSAACRWHHAARSRPRADARGLRAAQHVADDVRAFGRPPDSSRAASTRSASTSDRSASREIFPARRARRRSLRLRPFDRQA